jgi:hypothetical protein
MLESTKKFSAFFNSLTTWVRDGLLKPLGSAQEMEDGVKKIESFVTILNNLVKVMSALDAVIDKLANRKNKDISAFIPEINKLVGQISQINVGSLSKMGQGPQEEKPLRDMLSDEFKKGTILENAAGAAQNIASTGKPGSLAIPSAMRGEAVNGQASASTLGIDSAYEGITRERAGRTSSQTKEMTQIAEATMNQVSLLEKIEANTRKLVESMGNDKVSPQSGASGTSNRLPPVQNNAGMTDPGWGQLNSSARNASKGSLAITTS